MDGLRAASLPSVGIFPDYSRWKAMVQVLGKNCLVACADKHKGQRVAVEKADRAHRVLDRQSHLFALAWMQIPLVTVVADVVLQSSGLHSLVGVFGWQRPNNSSM